MRIFKTRVFAKFTRTARIADSSLREAVERAERGLVDADLGGGVIKQRVARQGQGRSGGYRMLVALRTDVRAVFLYGFAKNERDNIEEDELATLQEIAATWLRAGAEEIERAVADVQLQEVNDDDT
ncbi:MAG: type II toxin-antitoxin system RelE/ParE family toxin [Roseiarcus sp.]